MARQIEMKLPTWGGKRRNAGAKPKGEKALVSHAGRPKFERVLPAHVTLRVCPGLPSLRSSRRFAAIRRSFAAARDRFGVRIVEFSVLGNHLHLIVEADSSDSLSRGMQGLCIRLAKALNNALSRKGSLFADHYHSRLLRTPTELAHAIGYVLENAAHRFELQGRDFFSSAERPDVLSEPRGWLLRIGRRRSRKSKPAWPSPRQFRRGIGLRTDVVSRFRLGFPSLDSKTSTAVVSDPCGSAATLRSASARSQSRR
jgi:putative transposase